MIKVSERAHLMPSSPIRKLAPFAEAAKRKGLKVHQLNIGQPDIETPPAMIQAVKDADIRVLEYTPSAGIDSYRNKLSEFYRKDDINVEADDIIITSGGSESLLFAMMCCLDPGDEVIVPEPYYANYNGFASMAGVKVVTVHSTIENGFALPTISAFENVISPKSKAILICSPNNPTGYVYSKEEMDALKTICLKHELFLISDEAYRKFCYGHESAMSAMHLKGMDDYIVLVDTISKPYSACGARIGAFITKNKDLYETAMKYAQARLSPSTYGQILGEAALDLPSSYFIETRDEYKRRRDTLVSRLNNIPGVFCPTPEGAFYVMARLPIDNAEDFCQWLLESFEYQGQTLMMAPGAGFYGTPGLGKNEVRLAYVLNVNDLNASMDCLEEALKVYIDRN